METLQASVLSAGPTSTSELKALPKTGLGDVTQEEYEEYRKTADGAIADLLKRWPFAAEEVKAGFKTFISAVTKRYQNFPALLTIATFKKLCPEATSKELNIVYFASWVQEWLTTLARAIDDIGDDLEHTGFLDTETKQNLGAFSVKYMAMITSSLVDEMAQENLGAEPYFAELMRLFRTNLRNKLYGLTIEGVKYRGKLHDEFLNNERSQFNLCKSSLICSIEVAACVARAPADSELLTTSEKLAVICGSIAMTVADFAYVESDIRDRKLSWVFQTAFRKADEDQRRVLLNHSANGTTATTAAVFKIYEDLDITREFELHRDGEIQKFFDVLDASSEVIPKKTWEACLEIVQKIKFL